MKVNRDEEYDQEISDWTNDGKKDDQWRQKYPKLLRNVRIVYSGVRKFQEACTVHAILSSRTIDITMKQLTVIRASSQTIAVLVALDDERDSVLSQ